MIERPPYPAWGPAAPPSVPELPETAWKGIPPRLLLGQVASTAPFLFDPAILPQHDEPHLTFLRLVAKLVRDDVTERAFGRLSYFQLCLAAHHATVATFVPTDVDVHIREKLWKITNDVDELIAMAELVMDSGSWNNRSVSNRRLLAPNGTVLSGHGGEWFSTAAAAYGATRFVAKATAEELMTEIRYRLEQEAAAFESVREAGNGTDLLCAATVLAHNAGDLDRVIDAWFVGDTDPLRRTTYNSGHAPLPGLEAFHIAGELNKAIMAVENHRMFALRKARCLRPQQSLLAPFPPFLFDWGAAVAKSPALTPRDIGNVAENLVDGALRMPETVGYARALAGIESAFPGGPSALEREMPAKNARSLRQGALRTAIAVPERQFRGAWERAAWKKLKSLST